MSDLSSLDVDPAPLAAGAEWSMSAGWHDGARALVVHLRAGDVVSVRRGLAVVSSAVTPHLAPVRDVLPGRPGAVVVLRHPAGPSVAGLTARRGPLSAGEVATIVVPLARALACLHEGGAAFGGISAETLWLAADGRPVLVPASGDAASASGDVRALAVVASDALDPAAHALHRVLADAAAGAVTATELADAVLAVAVPAAVSFRAEPDPARRGSRDHARRGSRVRRKWGRRHRGQRARRRGRRRDPRLPVVLVVGTVVAGVAGALSAGRGGDAAAVLAAPPPVAATVGARPAASPLDSARGWRVSITALEMRRAYAYSAADPKVLASVYAPHSPTGAADLRTLQALVRQHCHARGLRAYVESVTVVAADDARAVLDVTDALTSYDVVASSGQVVRHGAGRPARTWRIALARTAQGWRIWSVRPA